MTGAHAAVAPRRVRVAGSLPDPVVPAGAVYVGHSWPQPDGTWPGGTLPAGARCPPPGNRTPATPPCYCAWPGSAVPDARSRSRNGGPEL